MDRLVVVREVQRITVAAPGPQGPPGPRGLPGIGELYHRHDQDTPASSFPVVHNLGVFTAVTILTDAGIPVHGDVEWSPDMNTTTITVPDPFTGIVIFS